MIPGILLREFAIFPIGIRLETFSKTIHIFFVFFAFASVVGEAHFALCVCNGIRMVVLETAVSGGCLKRTYASMD